MRTVSRDSSQMAAAAAAFLLAAICSEYDGPVGNTAAGKQAAKARVLSLYIKAGYHVGT